MSDGRVEWYLSLDFSDEPDPPRGLLRRVLRRPGPSSREQTLPGVFASREEAVAAADAYVSENLSPEETWKSVAVLELADEVATVRLVVNADGSRELIE